MALSRYQILGRVGSGGMGVVFRAQDLVLKRPVALKFLSGSHAGMAATPQPLLREAQLAATLNHPNVCTIHEIGLVEPADDALASRLGPFGPGTCFLVMEYVEGRTLETLLRESGPLPLASVLDVAIQVAEGLGAAHARGILHRDLKPKNVMLTPEGRVKILDFGLATSLAAEDEDEDGGGRAGRRERGRGFFGTPAYVSPERVAGAPEDARSDVFSFGTMLYEMVTGRAAFRGRDPEEILRSVERATPEPPTRFRPELPAVFASIVERCLRKHPEERYADTQALVRDLEALRETVSAPAPGTRGAGRAGDRDTEWVPAPGGDSRLVRSLAWSAGGALVLLLLGLGVLRHLRLPLGPRLLAAHDQITFTGTARLPALSPDGQFVAYVEGLSGTPQSVRLLDLASRRTLKVFQGWGIRALRWSPDGSELALTAASSPGKGQQVHIVPRLGGTARALGTGAAFQVSWSPDGKRVAACGNRTITLIDKSLGSTHEFEALDPGHTILDIDWSAASGLFLVLGEDARKQRAIWVVAEDPHGMRRLLEAGGNPTSPRWGPRGDVVYYLVSDGRTSTLCAMRVDPRTGERVGEPVQVMAFADIQDLALPRDGDRLVYTRQTSWSNLWLLEAAADRPGFKSRPLTTGTLTYGHPRFSPDGNRIVFPRGSGRRDLFVLDLGAREPRQVAFLDCDCEYPAWSPDGTEIAFGCARGDTARVWVVPAEGGSPRVFERSRLGSILAWEPGAHLLYQRPGNRNYHVLDTRTGDERPLRREDAPGWMFQLEASPDGETAAVARTRADFSGISVWLISLRDGSERLLLDDLAVPIGWSADGAWVYLVVHPPEGPASDTAAPCIVRVPAGGGPPQVLLDLPFATEFWSAIDITPDGRRIVCTVPERKTDLWVIENFAAPKP